VVVLSWPAVLEGLRRPCDGHDTALHEFAHVLDRASGAFDGTPVLDNRRDYQSWARVFSTSFQALRSGQWRERMVLRDYGAENEAEFFAVAVEAFFERPALMRRLLPELYAELRKYFRFDPAQDPCSAGLNPASQAPP
jgi:Mlc titration factor MtfA (ptsG expression regulator)